MLSGEGAASGSPPGLRTGLRRPRGSSEPGAVHDLSSAAPPPPGSWVLAPPRLSIWRLWGRPARPPTPGAGRHRQGPRPGSRRRKEPRLGGRAPLPARRADAGTWAPPALGPEAPAADLGGNCIGTPWNPPQRTPLLRAETGGDTSLTLGTRGTFSGTAFALNARPRRLRL